MLTGVPSYTRFSYISSATTKISFSTITFASFSSSSFVYTIPVGLLGVLRTRAFVFSLQAAASSSAVIL